MTKTTKFRISKPKNYTTAEGEDKTFWNDIGTLTVFEKEDGTKNTMIEIPAFGLEANVFPINKDKA